MSKETEKKVKQLELIIDEQRMVQTPEELLKYVIKLYGAEFIKANDEIFRLRSANDELFKLKQRTVIANGELMQKLELARKFCEAHREDYETLKHSDSMDVDADFVLLCQVMLDGNLPKEDFRWRLHNDARFHAFVEAMCEETLNAYKERHP